MRIASMLRAPAAVCLLWSGLLFGQQATPSPEPSAPSESLADIARKVRKDHTTEAKVTPEDAKEISRSVDKLFEFAVEDTGFPKKSAVKERMVGSADVEKYTREHMAKAEADQHFIVSEMTMKKFGLLPREFDLREFAAKANGQQIAGYYDEETKSISLLNWVPIEQQKASPGPRTHACLAGPELRPAQVGEGGHGEEVRLGL